MQFFAFTFIMSEKHTHTHPLIHTYISLKRKSKLCMFYVTMYMYVHLSKI